MVVGRFGIVGRSAAWDVRSGESSRATASAPLEVLGREAARLSGTLHTLLWSRAISVYMTCATGSEMASVSAPSCAKRPLETLRQGRLPHNVCPTGLDG